VLTAGSACCCCHLQSKHWKVAWYKDEPRDETATDAEYEDDDDDDDRDDEDQEVHSREPRPPSKWEANVGLNCLIEFFKTRV